MSDPIDPPDTDAPHRMVNGRRVLLTEAEIATRAAEEAAHAERPAPPRLIAKTTIYRRATDDELAMLEGFIGTQATPRQRLMWQDAEGGLVYVQDVLPLADALFGADRAVELLAA